jgi:hypothetical protein
MNHLRNALAYCLALLRGRGDRDEGAGLRSEDAPARAAELRSAAQRAHFWAEFHEGQRHAEERARPPR